MTLIALHGPIGSGKDCIYDRLYIMCCNEAPSGTMPEFRRIAFADPMKESIARLFGLDRSTIDDLKLSPYSKVIVRNNWKTIVRMSMRTFLQRYGTESHRDLFGTDFWVYQSLPHGFDHDGLLVVITDMRFPNEFNRAHELGAFKVWVDGPKPRPVPWWKRLFRVHTPDHWGESALAHMIDRFDFRIDNTIRDDNFASLDAQLRKMMTVVSSRPKGMLNGDAEIGY